jgi:hypothetical protein
LFGDPDMVPPKVPLSLCERERVRVPLDCMDTARALLALQTVADMVFGFTGV